MVKVLFFLLFWLISISNAYNSPKDHKLHLYLQQLQFSTIKPDLQYLKKLELEGSNIFSISQSGATTLHLAVESWAYSSMYNNPQHSDQLFEIIQYLVQRGVDVSPGDSRGYSPIFFIVYWGNANDKNFQPLINLMLEAKVDLNVVDYDQLSIAHMLARRSCQFELLDLLIKNGLNILSYDINQRNIFYYAAFAKECKDGGFKLKYFVDLIGIKLSKKLAEKPNTYGQSSLFAAVFANNLSAVKFLIEQLDVNPLIKDLSNKSALDYASELNYQNIITYLNQFSKSSEISNMIVCGQKNEFNDFNYQKLIEIIKTCKIKKIESLLMHLPNRYLTNYVAAYATQAAMAASPSHPQITIFGEDGKLMMTFNGSKFQNGYYSLEIIHFIEQSKKFELRVIEFPENRRNSEVIISKANPAKCISCHGTSPRPLWDTWTFWPGKFYGESQSVHPKEKIFLQEFLKNKKKGRYSKLPAQGVILTAGFNKKEAIGIKNNIKMDIVVDYLMDQFIAQLIKENKKLVNFKYSVLAALSCSHDFPQNYIQEKIRATFNKSITELESDTRIQAQNEIYNRINLLKEYLNGLPEDRLTLDNIYFPNGWSKDSSGSNFDIKRTTQIRYIMDNLSIGMNNWFTPFNFGITTTYTKFNWNVLERILWKELLNKEHDRELWDLYEEKSKELISYSIEDVPSLFWDLNSNSASISICQKLSEKSLSY